MRVLFFNEQMGCYFFLGLSRRVCPVVGTLPMVVKRWVFRSGEDE